MLKTFVELNKIVGKKINNDLHWQNKQSKMIKINNVIMQHNLKIDGLFGFILFTSDIDLKYF